MGDLAFERLLNHVLASWPVIVTHCVLGLEMSDRSAPPLAAFLKTRTAWAFCRRCSWVWHQVLDQDANCGLRRIDRFLKLAPPFHSIRSRANATESVRADHTKQADTRLLGRISRHNFSPAVSNYSVETYSIPDFLRTFPTAEFSDHTGSQDFVRHPTLTP